MNTNAQNSSSSLSARNLENKQILETYFLNDSILDISSAIENIEYLRTVINSCFACQSKEEVSIFCKLLYKTLELPLDDRLDIMSAYNNQIMFMDSRSSFWILRASTFKKDGGKGLLLTVAPAHEETDYVCIFKNKGAYFSITKERLEESGYEKLD